MTRPDKPTIEKLQPGDPDTQSADVVAENIAKLKALFPEIVTEGEKGASVNVDVLKQLVGDATVTDCDEKFGLNWHGKRRARQLALTASTGTLRPCPEESVDWDTTQNLFIEGDNLEVLKLLQKSYAGRVKMIYIDPPYNTGNDFVYSDDFADPIEHYRKLVGLVGDDGQRLTSNTDTSGRFHTNWLNMMQPRLMLARQMLCRGGAIFVSIDDKEVSRLRNIMDAVFGEENFLAQVVWEGAHKNTASQIGINHEYVLVYARSADDADRDWGISKGNIDPVVQEAKRLVEKHNGDYDKASADLTAWYRTVKSKPVWIHRRFNRIDKRGVYKENDPTAPGGRRFDLKHPDGHVIPLRSNRGWGFSQDDFDKLVADDRIVFVTASSIMVKSYLEETDKVTPQSVIYQPTRSASERLAKLFGANVFEYPKDERVLQQFVEMITREDDIVMDFFAGSGTTGHAVMAQVAEDGLKRSFVLVQLPEQINSADKTGDAKKIAEAAEALCDQLGRPRRITELSKERLRRAANQIVSESPMFRGDTGFRVFKLDSSNIREWDPDRENFAQSLEDSVDNIKPGRTEQDILYELLLKRGLDLCVPIETKEIAGKTVHSIGAGTLFACLSESITPDEGEPLALGIAAWHQELDPAGDTTVVFRDSAFADDVVKTNVAAILDQSGLKNMRSL
jgi:adenine-specific DNA-methyltransferase